MKPILQKCLCILLAASSYETSHAQSVAINDDASLPHPSAILDVKVAGAAKKGVLFPRMTSAERITILTPAKGLLVFDNTTNGFWFHNGTAWQELSKGANAWTVNGTNVYNIPGNIGIGISSPKAKLNVVKNTNVLFGKSMSGLGKKLIWNGTKAAFRAGEVQGNYPNDVPPYDWDDANIGYGSFAAGADVRAVGDYSTAIGQSTDAIGATSFASGVWSVSEGVGAATFGFAGLAKGESSFSAGYSNFSSGDYTASFNETNASMGIGSFTGGLENTSNGAYTVTFGKGNINNALHAMTIGEYNSPLAAVTGANAPLFVIGNGTEANHRNSFVALRNGIVSINKNPGTAVMNDGYLQVKQAGTRHALTLEASTTTNKWSFYVTPALTLYYNNALRGTFNSTTGAYVAASDIRLKKDIRDLPPVLSNIMRLKTYTYHLLDNENTEPLSYGLMAHELQQVFPDMVNEIEPGSNESMLGINYTNFGVIAIKAIQEQQLEIHAQHLQIDEQQKLIDSQQKQIRKQEDRLNALEKLCIDLRKQQENKK